MTASSALHPACRPDLGSTFALSGCRPFPLSAAEMDDYDGHYEYWEAGVAWELRDTSPKHERPRVRLAELTGDIAKMRGMPIALFGTAGVREAETDLPEVSGVGVMIVQLVARTALPVGIAVFDHLA